MRQGRNQKLIIAMVTLALGSVAFAQAPDASQPAQTQPAPQQQAQPAPQQYQGQYPNQGNGPAYPPQTGYPQPAQGFESLPPSYPVQSANIAVFNDNWLPGNWVSACYAPINSRDLAAQGQRVLLTYSVPDYSITFEIEEYRDQFCQGQHHTIYTKAGTYKVYPPEYGKPQVARVRQDYEWDTGLVGPRYDSNSGTLQTKFELLQFFNVNTYYQNFIAFQNLIPNPRLALFRWGTEPFHDATSTP